MSQPGVGAGASRLQRSTRAAISDCMRGTSSRNSFLLAGGRYTDRNFTR